MDFGSSFVLDRESDDESYYEDDGLAYSDCEDEDMGLFDDIDAPDLAEAPEEKAMASSGKRGKKKKAVKIRKADTNVISVNLAHLADKSPVMTGDPTFCKACHGMFNSLSKTSKSEEDLLWKCEFCDTENLISLEPEEIPKAASVDYVLTLPSAKTKAMKAAKAGGLVIFCIDISGSMCVTSEVVGKHRFKGHDKLSELQKLNTEGAAQYFPGQKKNITYVSRLQCVQAAIDAQLTELAKTNPSCKVGIVTFNNEVTVVGDATGMPKTITGDVLKDYESLYGRGQALAIANPIKDTREALSKKLFSLSEGGATALGPAILSSVAMASKTAGSKVIICTDGLANVGLGELEGLSDTALTESELFYTKIAAKAADLGVLCSVVSIKGAGCRMENLGKIADHTGGNVNMVDPLQLTKEFSSMLADEILATKVKASLLLHKGLHFRTLDEIEAEEDEEKKHTSKMEKDIGNVTKETEITFEYGVNRDFKLAEKLKEVPFQVQITYTKLDGTTCIRSVTATKKLTKDRDLAEKNANIAVIGTHQAQQTAKLAFDGDYSVARFNAFSAKKLMKRAAAAKPEAKKSYNAWKVNVRKMDTALDRARRSERSKGVALSDSSGSEEDDTLMAGTEEKKEEKREERRKIKLKKKKMKKAAKTSSRAKSRADSAATVFYQFKKYQHKSD